MKIRNVTVADSSSWQKLCEREKEFYTMKFSSIQHFPGKMFLKDFSFPLCRLLIKLKVHLYILLLKK